MNWEISEGVLLGWNLWRVFYCVKVQIPGRSKDLWAIQTRNGPGVDWKPIWPVFHTSLSDGPQFTKDLQFMV